MEDGRHSQTFMQRMKGRYIYIIRNIFKTMLV